MTCRRLPAAGGVARGRRGRPAAALPRRGLLGATGGGVRRPAARVAIVGLAPAAHGANRTGRMFTGDRSGDWLYAALHRAGFANQPESVRRDDGLRLRDAYVTAIVRCAPPANKPTAAGARQLPPLYRAGAGAAEEQPRDRRAGRVRLGRRAAGAPRAGRRGAATEAADSATAPRRRSGRWTLLGCYHPSQQNTFTGKLTEAMLDGVFARAQELAG